MEESKTPDDSFLTKLLKKMSGEQPLTENEAISVLGQNESVRIIIPGAIDFSMVFEGDKKQVLDDIFDRIKDLMGFMAERNEEMEKTLKIHQESLEKQREETDISVA